MTKVTRTQLEEALRPFTEMRAVQLGGDRGSELTEIVHFDLNLDLETVLSRLNEQL